MHWCVDRCTCMHEVTCVDCCLQTTALRQPQAGNAPVNTPHPSIEAHMVLGQYVQAKSPLKQLLRQSVKLYSPCSPARVSPLSMHCRQNPASPAAAHTTPSCYGQLSVGTQSRFTPPPLQTLQSPVSTNKLCVISHQSGHWVRRPSCCPEQPKKRWHFLQKVQNRQQMSA
jgi:hypothetical protein